MSKKILALLAVFGMMLLGSVFVAGGASATTDTNVVAIWHMPAVPTSAHDTSWPQTLVTTIPTNLSGADALALADSADLKCGTAYQVDVYKNSAETTKVLAQNLAGPNNPFGEDFATEGGWGVNYKLITTPACPITPVKCVASGSWTTEDVAPVQEQNGLLFAGPSVPSVNWYHPLSGNLQGAGASITYSKVSGYHASLVFEIFRTGTTGYATINAEPYLNGWAPGQTGTFTVNQSTLVWTSKIASGPGSQSSPITMAAMGALFPTNKLISEGIHLGTNSVEGQSSLVTSVGGCVTDNFVPVVVPPKPQDKVVVSTVTGSPVCGVLLNGLSTVTSVTTTTTTTYKLVDNKWVGTSSSVVTSSESAPVSNAACTVPERGGAPTTVPTVIDSGL